MLPAPAPEDDFGFGILEEPRKLVAPDPFEAPTQETPVIPRAPAAPAPAPEPAPEDDGFGTGIL